MIKSLISLNTPLLRKKNVKTMDVKDSHTHMWKQTNQPVSSKLWPELVQLSTSEFLKKRHKKNVS